MRRFACPPWYECRCVRGKVVCYATMRNHKQKANRRRLALGRGPFKNGPQVPANALEYYFSSNESLVDHATDDEEETDPSLRTSSNPNSSLQHSSFHTEPQPINDVLMDTVNSHAFHSVDSSIQPSAHVNDTINLVPHNVSSSEPTTTTYFVVGDFEDHDPVLTADEIHYVVQPVPTSNDIHLQQAYASDNLFQPNQQVFSRKPTSTVNQHSSHVNQPPQAPQDVGGIDEDELVDEYGCQIPGLSISLHDFQFDQSLDPDEMNTHCFELAE